MSLCWGLLGPETLVTERRTRTLNLGASVRAFNELAVPGLGGAWYAKQLFLAALGVRVAETARRKRVKVTNIEAANAIEAIACWMGFARNGHAPDARLRGHRKLEGMTGLTFAQVRRSGFYVSQPMRMSIVQALPALGIVEAGASRFNAFRSTPLADALLEAQASAFEPCHYSRGVIEYLVHWIQSGDCLTDKAQLREALSPLAPMTPDARAIIEQQLLVSGDRAPDSQQERRGAALRWVEAVRRNQASEPRWEQRPHEHISEPHWSDLRAGARFFLARDAALEALDAIEAHIGNSGGAQRFVLGDALPERVANRLDALQAAARRFIDERHHDADANEFCQQCAESDRTERLAAIVTRDERVLRLRSREIVPGPAFRGAMTPASAADPDEPVPYSHAQGTWPEGISYRIRNLFLLNADLRGELDQWLATQ
ncbi:hypothetical protein CR51_31160 [Caballeronia megalochromosomata]|nr:hypothetical protein CR51_31160 [Caballeronia megalochromosomata]